MKTLLPIIALTALTAACGASDSDKAAKAAKARGAVTVKADDAMCRPTANGRDMTGCYVTLKASGDDRLMSVAAPDAATAQIHEMKTENGMMRMAEIQGGLALPSGQDVKLAPGGNHIMLMGLSRPLVEGESVSMTLGFEKAEPVTVVARVAQPPLPGTH